MTIFVRVLACAALLAPVADATAQPANMDNSANGVYAGCKMFAQGQPTPNAQLAMMGNYCSGVLHGLAGMGQYVTVPEWISCVPSESSTSQLARVFIKFVDEHPERMHQDFRVLTLESFHYAFPCKSGR
jgi:hypothetical protein